MPAFVVSANESGRSVVDLLSRHLSQSVSAAQRLVRNGQVFVGPTPCLDPSRRLRRGQRVEVRDRHAEHQRLPAGIEIRHVDAHVVVVDKPPGLTTMRHAEEAAEFGRRARRFLPPTLADLLPARLAQRRPGPPGRLRAVHRLDEDTSGLVVFARTPEAERVLGRQFRAHTIERCYVAIVRGRAQSGRIESHIAPDRGDHRRGATLDTSKGKRAVTHVRVVEELGDYTLVECRLETGRTHQVRIHLAESGTPICGERVYDRPVHGKPLPDASGAPRLALHAALLGFDHPASGKRLRWRSRLPKDLAQLLARLRDRGARK
jgi:23S rRNA pseudouridine1911/1915/1917 synthase